jgi:4-carboxymuconolactone decarboxylase
MDMKLDPAGLARRTEVMGTGFVDQALQDVDAFNLPLQQWVTAHAWGSTWQRDGIDLRTRSLVTIAMLAALGRSHELRAYVRGAVNNGAGWVEIREVLLHAGVYAGAPAAVEGFRVARAVLLEMGISLAEEPPAA